MANEIVISKIPKVFHGFTNDVRMKGNENCVWMSECMLVILENVRADHYMLDWLNKSKHNEGMRWLHLFMVNKIRKHK